MEPTPTQRPSRWIGSLVVLGFIAVLAAAVLFLNDGAEFFSLKTIGLNYATLKHWVEHQYALSLLAYIGAYLVIAAFMMPGSAMLTTLGGLLFGIAVGFPSALLGSILGAGLAYHVARLLFAGPFRRANARLIDRLQAGFKRHGLGYMLSLRLAPGIPSGVINVAPALIGVPFATFLLGSALGFIPSRLALATAGAGLGRVIEAENLDYAACLQASQNAATTCPYKIDVSQLLTNEVVAAFVALALLALLPAALDAIARLRAKRKERPDVKV